MRLSKRLGPCRIARFHSTSNRAVISTTEKFIVLAGTSEFDKGLAQAQDQSVLTRTVRRFLSFRTPVGTTSRKSFTVAAQGHRPVSPTRRVSPSMAFSTSTSAADHGGSLYSFTAHGSDTANMVLRLWRAQRRRKTFPRTSTTRYFSIGGRWCVGASAKAASPGGQIMFVSAIVLVQAGLILILQHEHRRRRLAARLTGMPGSGTFTARFSHNACYASMNRNLVDCARIRAKTPESISTLSSR